MINVSFRNEFSWALIVVMAGAVISLALSLQAGLFFMFFAAAAWWTWEHPWDGFTFFIIIAPLLPMFKITQTIGTVTLIKDVIILTLFAKLFLFPLLQKTLPYRRNMLFAPVVTLALWALFSLLRADSLLLGVLRARDIGLYALLYFAVLYLPRSTKRWRETASWFAASVVVVLLLAIYQWFFAVDSAVLRFDPVRDIWIPRLSSIMAHPSIFGQYLVLAALLGAAIAWHTRGRTRMTAALLAAATVPFIFLTYSRGVWIGFILGIGAMALVVLARAALNKVRGPQVWRWAGAGGAGLLVLLLLAIKLTPVGVYVRSALDPTYGSNEERIEFAARLIAPMANVEALVGRGLGDVLVQNFRAVDLQAIDIAAGAAREVQLTKNATLVDNQWLKTFVEMGLAGLLIYGWMFWRVGKQAWQVTEITGLWGLGFLAAFIIQGFFIDIWDIFPTNAAFWVVAAMVSGAGAVDAAK